MSTEQLPLVLTSYFAKCRYMGDKRILVPISIARHNPPWWHKYGQSYLTLAPSKELLRAWKADEITWEEYTVQYNAYLNLLSQRDVVAELYNLVEAEARTPRTVMAHTVSDIQKRCRDDAHIVPVLVCYEKPSDCCHRHLVSAWLRAGGCAAEEADFNKI